MNNDKIYDAYTGKLGKTFQDTTINRINWILSNISIDDTVLDVGCSQGIISILAAQKAKKVTGIDIEEHAIESAQKILCKKYKELSDKVDFFCEDFMESQLGKTFDHVVITEVLEHLESPAAFLDKAAKHLNTEGTLILSVPLGICEHPDHKMTYYLSDFIALLKENYFIKDIVFIDRWIGAVLSVGKQIDSVLTEELLERYDKSRGILDREAVDRINSLYENCTQANHKYKEALKNYSTAKKWLEEKNVSLQKSKQDQDALAEELNVLKDQYLKASDGWKNEKCNLEKLQKLYQELCSEVEVLKEDVSSAAEELKDVYYDLGEDVVLLEHLKNRIRQLEIQNNYLKSENNEYRKKIQLITDTLLGKIGLKAYRFIKKLKSR